MELRIINPTEDGFIKKIEWNYQELKAEVAARMEEYRNLVYDEQGMKSAKTDRAALNKFRRALDDKRKEIKRFCLSAYERFEEEINEIITLVDEPINLIGNQIKEVEEQYKAEKKSLCMEIYERNIGTLKGIVPFEKAFQARYLNKGETEKKIEEEMQGLFLVVNRELDTIESLKSKYEMQIKDVYIETLDLSTALREHERLEKLANELAKKKQAEEQRQQEKAAAVAANAGTAPSPQNPPQPLVTPPTPPVAQPMADTVLHTLDFRVVATKEQIGLLKEFLQLNHIKFGPVPKEGV